MKLRTNPDYFFTNKVFIAKDNNTKYLQISNCFTDQLELWESNSKMSPCFRVEDDILNTENIVLSGQNFFLFIGPLSLNKIRKDLLKDTRVWLGYGAYNIIISTSDTDKIEQIIAFLEKNLYRYEFWQLKDNIISDYKIFMHEVAPKHKLSKKLMSRYRKNNLMFAVVRGYYSQIVMACERLRYINKESFNQIIEFHNSVENFVLSTTNNKESEEEISLNFSYINTINACLTRFNSQIITGFSPILEQENTVCGHSLFGIGLAGIGVNNIGDFFYYKVGKQFIDQKFIHLLEEKYTKEKALSYILSTDPFWRKDHIGNIPVNESPDPNEKQMPLLVFFSSRDGFRNQYNTLSIPLIALYGCNTPGWSLKTISHEASHLIIDTMLDYLLRNLNDKDWVDKFYKLCSPNTDKAIDTVEEAILQLFGRGLIAFDNEEIFDLHRAYEARKDDIKEIMTHAFDFLYFYQSDLKTYIEEIWASWVELPRITTFLPEYIKRSLCIIVLNHLDIPKIEDKAIGILREILEKLQKEKKHVCKNGHIKEVLDYLNPQKNGDIIKQLKDKIIYRKFLVEIVRAFFFSEKIRSVLSKEKWPVGSKKADKIKKYELPERPFSNPLSIVEADAKSKKLSEVESYLLFYNLAFNYDRG
jgi:hypothetical protein